MTREADGGRAKGTRKEERGQGKSEEGAERAAEDVLNRARKNCF